MDNEPTLRVWHASIVEECRRILGRNLTAAELTFITSRGGFIALERIDDTVASLADDPEQLQSYLRSEA